MSANAAAVRAGQLRIQRRMQQLGEARQPSRQRDLPPRQDQANRDDAAIEQQQCAQNQ